MNTSNYPSREELLLAAQKKKNILRMWLIIVIASIFLIPMLMASFADNDEQTGYTDKTVDSVSYRQKLIDRQFSAWDGSHINLTQYIKDRMHDPDSYEHVETKYYVAGEILIVVASYRGNNAFGAKVLNSTQAEVSMDGQILKVFE